MFLSDGARIYVDCGAHQEWCTPECANPWDVVRYQLAGERILAELAHAITGKKGIANAAFYRCNVDYLGSTTWGAHESVLHRADPDKLAADILPFLVSRLIFTGAGGFDPTTPCRFTLSPRAAYLQHAVSPQSTHDRGIFHSKDESLSADGFHRAHILCGDSLCSHQANWLRAATLVIAIALTEAGLHPGEAVALHSPVQAIQSFAADPTCRVTVSAAGQGRLSALDIQRHYLHLAEANRDEPFMPSWTAQALLQWRNILDRLERGPFEVDLTLDWAIKRRLFIRHVERNGLHWSDLSKWDRVLRTIASLPEEIRRQVQAPALIKQRLQTSGGGHDQIHAIDSLLKRSGLTWTQLVTMQRVRLELFELDTRFGELGAGGIFNTLDAANLLEHRFPGVDNIEHAMVHPPAIGRAKVRGDAVRRLSGSSGKMADWNAIQDVRGGRVMDLSNPWESEERWKDMKFESDGSRHPLVRLRRMLP